MTSAESGHKGRLSVVGSGIRLGQLTQEAKQAIVGADVVFAVVAEMLTLLMLQELNSALVDLGECYALEKRLLDTYDEMAAQVMTAVRAGKSVCLVIYGHPGVFARPARLTLTACREEGFDWAFLPGISAEDSLFCDLQIDPAMHGSQVYLASRFVREDRVFDPRAVLTLWQVSIIGQDVLRTHSDPEYHARLCDKLEAVYGPDHPIVLYEAATNPFFGPVMQGMRLAELREAKVHSCCTLVIPPIDRPDLIRVSLSSGEPERISWEVAGLPG